MHFNGHTHRHTHTHDYDTIHRDLKQTILQREIYQTLPCQLKIKLPEEKQRLLEKTLTCHLCASDEALMTTDPLHLLLLLWLLLSSYLMWNYNRNPRECKTFYC